MNVSQYVSLFPSFWLCHAVGTNPYLAPSQAPALCGWSSAFWPRSEGNMMVDIWSISGWCMVNICCISTTDMGFPWVHTWLMMINIWLIYGSSWDNISLYDGSQWVIIWVKECHKPPIWEWFIPNLFLVIWMMFRYCFTHIRGTDPTPRNLT